MTIICEINPGKVEGELAPWMTDLTAFGF